MPVNDPIGDLLTRMRNAQHARRDSCICPWSRHKEEICRVMKRAGFLASVEVEGEGIARTIIIGFDPARPVLSLERVSKPGRRFYSPKGNLTPVRRGYGIAVLTTSRGVMTDREARREGIGGEVLCTIF